MWGMPPWKVMDAPLVWIVRQAEYGALRQKIENIRLKG